MSIHIERLTPAIMADFFDFFDRRAFFDHSEWSGCYCLESHLKSVDDVEYTADGRAIARSERGQVAKELITNGVMTGYLLYDGAIPVGWANVGDKTSYAPIMQNDALFTVSPAPGQIKIIYCMDISADYRGGGLSDALLSRAIEDAIEEGYGALEGYPFADASYPYQYRGPRHLYEKHGFSLFREAGYVSIMRLVFPCDARYPRR